MKQDSHTTVKLYEQNSSTPLQTTTTQSGSQIGEYVFNALPDGAYYVVSDIENNYQSVTVPGSSSSPSGYIYAHTVTIANGQAVIDKNFGVFSKSGETSISGKVYYDSNLNGDFDGNDYGIGGLYVKLFNGNSLVQAAETWLSGPATGNYTFQNVPDGFYIIVLSEEDNYPTVTEPGPHIDLSGGILNDYDYVYFLNISGGQSITGPITGADFGVSNKRKFIKWDLRIKERINNLTVSPNTEPIINPGGKPTIKDWDLEARKQRRESASEEDKKKTNALGAWLFKLFD